MNVRQVQVPLTAGVLVDGGKKFLGLRLDPNHLDDAGDSIFAARVELYDVSLEQTIHIFTNWMDMDIWYSSMLEDWNSFFPRGLSDKGAYFICYAEERDDSFLDDMVYVECFNKETFESEARFAISKGIKRFQYNYAVLDAVKISEDRFLVACSYQSDVGFELFCYDKRSDTVRSLGLNKNKNEYSFSSIWFDDSFGNVSVQWGEKEECNWQHMRQHYQPDRDLTTLSPVDHEEFVVMHEEVEDVNTYGFRFVNGLEYLVHREGGFLKRARITREVKDSRSGQTLVLEETGKDSFVPWIARDGDLLFIVRYHISKAEKSLIFKTVAIDRGLYRVHECSFLGENNLMLPRLDERESNFYLWNLTQTVIFSAEE